MRKLSPLILVITYLFVIFLSNYSVSANVGVSSGDWLSYKVVSASDTVNDFYGTFPPGTYYGAWSVVADDSIIFNITSVHDGVTNGTLFFGNELDNVTFYDVRNVDTAFGLGLGIYPWSGGFLANSTDWDNILSSVVDTNTTVTQIESYNLTIAGMQNSYSVIHFNTSNYYGQYSSFYYHKSSGVLLKAFTSFGLYELEISLDIANLEINPYTETPYTETVTVSMFILLLSIISLPALSMLKRKSK